MPDPHPTTTTILNRQIMKEIYVIMFMDSSIHSQLKSPKIMLNVFTMLAMHAEADPPPGAELLAPSCSTNERTVELKSGPSALLWMQYL